MGVIIKDELGNLFSALKEAVRYHGGSNPSGGAYARLNKNGFITYNGHVFECMKENPTSTSGDEHKEMTSQRDVALLSKLRERYSDGEIEAIIRGEGIAKRYIPFPEIHLKGEHHRIVVLSDTHIGSVYSPEEWHNVVSEYVNDPANGVECVLHCGDLVDGFKIGRAGTQIYELSEIGFDAQRDKAVELMKKYSKPIYIISGNHDAYFKEFAGANIVKAVCDKVPNMAYIGHDSADIDIGGCVVRLFHGGDGSSYAISYRMQKLVEAINGGHKPNILLAGHTHKFCYIMERNIHAISVPSLQAQTSFMRAKKISAHTGFLVLDFDTNGSGIANLSVNYFPFYA